MSKDTTNPNRPTPAIYCANCAPTSTRGCLYRGLPGPCTSHQYPRPLTPYYSVMTEALDALVTIYPTMNCVEVALMISAAMVDGKTSGYTPKWAGAMLR